MQLIPIKYHDLNYPIDVRCEIKEVAGHFDIRELDENVQANQFSLHTEYSANRRNFDSNLIESYVKLKGFKTQAGKPKLWQDNEWAEEFAKFIIELCGDLQPKIIEIHPPNSRRISLEDFFNMYNSFYSIIRDRYPDSEVLLENRNGFLLSGIADFKAFSDFIDQNNIDLKLILDFPQLLNYEAAKNDIVKLSQTLEEINFFKHNVDAFHIWGQNGRNSHSGDMRDYFNNNEELEREFYEKIGEIFAGEDKNHYFIPEINYKANGKQKDECLSNIINNLRNVGFTIN